MVDKENCARVTRSAARKRVPDAGARTARAADKRQRVVLGELPDPSNVAAGPRPPLGLKEEVGKPKPRGRKKKPQVQPDEQMKRDEGEKPLVKGAAVVDIDSSIGDPQLCAHYATDIYRYLRSMEVVAAPPFPPPCGRRRS